MFQNLKKLYDNRQYANAVPIGNLLLTQYSHDRGCLTADQHFLTLAYLGTALLADHQHRHAEQILTSALQAKKYSLKLRSAAATAATTAADSPSPDTDRFSLAAIRYSLAECCEATRQIPEAIGHLQAIPAKQRNCSMNWLLAKLQLQTGIGDKSAIPLLKATLLECPLHLDAIRQLLALKVPIAEVAAVLEEAGLSLQQPAIAWLRPYMVAVAHVHEGRFAEAIEALDGCEAAGVHDAEAVLVLRGQCWQYLGEKERAVASLERAWRANPFLVEGLQSLAAVYAATDRLDELERLTLPGVAPVEYTAEYWFVLALHLFVQRKWEKAAHFAQKACFAKAKNVEAMLLKVRIYMQSKNYKEAIVTLRVLQPYADYRFEVHEALVNAFIATNRLGDAQVVGRDVLRRHHRAVLSARYYVLLVRPYLVRNEPQHRARVKKLLQRALEKDEYHLPAAMLLVALLRHEGDRWGTIAVLKKQLESRPNSKLYTMLGELMGEEKDQAKAVEYYTIAMNLDPHNSKAVASLIAIGASINPKAAAELHAAGAASYGSQSSDEDSGPGDGAVMSVMAESGGGAASTERDSDEALWTDIEIEMSSANA